MSRENSIEPTTSAPAEPMQQDEPAPSTAPEADVDVRRASSARSDGGDRERERERDSSDRDRDRERSERRRSPPPVRRPDHAPANPPKSEVLGVFGLSVRTREQDLEEEFGRFGRVEKVVIVYDQRSDRSRGFGFITMATVEDAQRCIENISGKSINGRTIRVDYSITTRPHQSTPGEYMGVKRIDDDRRPYDRYDRGVGRDGGRRDDYRSSSGRDDYGRSSRDDFGRSSRDDYGRSSRDDYGRSSRDDYGRSSRDEGRSSRDDYGRSSKDDWRSSRDSRDRSPRPSRRSPSPRRRSGSRSPGPSRREREPLPPRDYDDAPSGDVVPAVRW